MNGKLDANLLSGFAIDGPGGSNIKSIQRGTSVLTNGGASTLNVTISSVNLSKTIVKFTSLIISTSGSLNSLCNAKVTTATNLLLTRNSTTGGDITVEWEIIEFNNVKSIQTGNYTLSTMSGTVTITTVDTTKSSLYYSAYNSADTDSYTRTMTGTGKITNATTLTFALATSGVTKIIEWIVIEFN